MKELDLQNADMTLAHHKLGDLIARVVAQPAANLLPIAVADPHGVVIAEVAGHL